MHVLRDLTAKDTTAGVLQRILADRVLSLLPRENSAATSQLKRKREMNGEPRAERHDLADTIKTEVLDTNGGDGIIGPGRPERTKKPTAKAKQYEKSHLP